jgi:hypothetical protein
LPRPRVKASLRDSVRERYTRWLEASVTNHALQTRPLVGPDPQNARERPERPSQSGYLDVMSAGGLPVTAPGRVG